MHTAETYSSLFFAILRDSETLPIGDRQAFFREHIDLALEHFKMLFDLGDYPAPPTDERLNAGSNMFTSYNQLVNSQASTEAINEEIDQASKDILTAIGYHKILELRDRLKETLQNNPCKEVQISEVDRQLENKMRFTERYGSHIKVGEPLPYNIKPETIDPVAVNRIAPEIRSQANLIANQALCHPHPLVIATALIQVAQELRQESAQKYRDAQ